LRALKSRVVLVVEGRDVRFVPVRLDVPTRVGVS